MSRRYQSSGVNLESGYEVVKRIKKHVNRTANQGVMSQIGSFGGLFDLASYKYDDPVLVSGTDGVGTKLQLAIDTDRHSTIGIDLVGMCVNDIITQGADPLFFLDYLAVGKNNPDIIEQIVAGVSEGCVQAKMALIGGETAEMPGMYDVKAYDLAGFAVGCVNRGDIIDISNVQVGDVLLGFYSSGFHSNGYSLIRQIIKESSIDLNESLTATETVLDALLAPTRIYVDAVNTLKKYAPIHSMIHITGGGFDENIPRGLPQAMGADIDCSSWKRLPIFDYFQEKGNLTSREMLEVFNGGIGFIAIVSEEDANQYLMAGHEGVIIGTVTNNGTLEIR